MGGMLGGLGGGGSYPAGAYSSTGIGAPTTSQSSVYAPTGQATADTQAQGLLTGLYDLSPSVHTLATDYANNPYYNQALTGAQTGADYGSSAANQASGFGSSLYQPFYSSLDYGYQTALPMADLQSAGKQVYNTAFDPQASKYQQGLQQTTDSANAIGSMYGLGSSPYGAGLTNDAVRNYNIDWQDRQLDRQTQGLRGLALGDISAGQLGTAATGDYTAAGTLGKDALAEGYGAADLSYTSAGLPSQSYVKNLGDKYTGYSDVSKYDTSLYNSLGNYLGLGQQASTISGDLGNMGYKQKSADQSSAGSLGSSLWNSALLFGSGGLSGALGLGSGGLLGEGLSGLGGLFGGGDSLYNTFNKYGTDLGTLSF